VFVLRDFMVWDSGFVEGYVQIDVVQRAEFVNEANIW
jgi:hypothetical protein